MINYPNKGQWIKKALQDAGYYVSRTDGVFHVYGVGGRMDHPDDVTAAQAICDSFDPLPFAKAAKKKQIKAVAASKVAVIYAFVVEEDEDTQTAASDIASFYDFASDIYTSILPSARDTLALRLQSFKGIRDAAADAIAVVNAMSDWETVMAYDAQTDPVWP